MSHAPRTTFYRLFSAKYQTSPVLVYTAVLSRHCGFPENRPHHVLPSRCDFINLTAPGGPSSPSPFFRLFSGLMMNYAACDLLWVKYRIIAKAYRVRVLITVYQIH